MRISVLGAGYTGAVSAACLARDGHTVIAVDNDRRKVAAIAAGRSPVAEPGLDDLLAEGVRSGRLTATDETRAALHTTDVSLVCVGTPARADGSLDVTDVIGISREIGNALATKNDRHAVVVRSTVLPGTTERFLAPAIEAASRKRTGRDFGLAYYPEFMREGTSIADFDNPGTVVVGASDGATAELMRALLAPRTPREVPIATAEAVKYANNAWHGLKVTFANEIGRICKAVGIDSHDVMDALVADTKLNTSGAYLRPGFAYGGSCLPKDIAALRHRAAMDGVATPVLDAIVAGNDTQIEQACDLVLATGNRRVGIVGLSFKPDTDDLRRSPLLELAARLAARGLEVRFWEPSLHPGRAAGPDARVDRRLGDLAALLVPDAAALVAASETIVIGNARLAAPLMDDFARAGRAIVDLARVDRSRRSGGAYSGIAW